MHRPHRIIQVALLAAFVSIIASTCGGAAAIVTPAATGAIATPAIPSHPLAGHRSPSWNAGSAGCRGTASHRST